MIIDKAQELSKQVLILVGSASESHTLRNPFTSDFRIELLKKVYNNKNIRIEKLNDMTNEKDICFEWGRYILNHVEEKYRRIPDLMVCGKDESRKGWFSEEDSQKFSELIIARNKLEISATELRKLLVQDCKQEWKGYVPEQIWDMYGELRKELLELECYQNKKEI